MADHDLTRYSTKDLWLASALKAAGLAQPTAHKVLGRGDEEKPLSEFVFFYPTSRKEEVEAAIRAYFRPRPNHLELDDFMMVSRRVKDAYFGNRAMSKAHVYDEEDGDEEVSATQAAEEGE